MAIGFTLPFETASGSLGGLETTNDVLSATRENLKSLLLTNWGERVVHFYMGCNLREFLFEPMRDATLREKIADRIVSQTKQWMPFVELTELNLYFSGDTNIPDTVDVPPENGVGVQMSFFLSSRPNQVQRLYQVVVP